MKLHPARIAKQARDSIGHLSSVEAHAELLGRVNDWIDDGRHGTDFEAVKRGGSEGSAQEMRAVRGQSDRIGIAVSRLDHCMKQALRWSQEARRISDALTTVYSGDPDKPNPYGPGEGDCVVCGAYVPGIAADRLRKGRCEPCYRYNRDHDGIDRPREMWAPSEEDAA